MTAVKNSFENLKHNPRFDELYTRKIHCKSGIRQRNEPIFSIIFGKTLQRRKSHSLLPRNSSIIGVQLGSKYPSALNEYQKLLAK